MVNMTAASAVRFHHQEKLMLFLVISTPRPDHPTNMIEARTKYWDWMRALIDSGQSRMVYARVGRGAVALFDVDSNDTLHRLINEWSEIIPAHHEIFPLLDEDAAKVFLAKQTEELN
jgi:muconolactone delta-isomerase